MTESLKRIQELRGKVFHSNIDAVEKLREIFNEGKNIPQTDELFPDTYYDVLSFDYKLDPNNSIIEIKKEIEDLTHLFLLENFKTKVFLGNFAYSIDVGCRNSIINLVMDFFNNACIEKTNVVMCSTALPQSESVEPKESGSVRLCMFREK